MKPKVYKLACAAVLCLAAMSTRGVAQQSASPAAPATPATPPAQSASGSYAYSAPAPLVTFNGLSPLVTFNGQDNPQDTTYSRKMRELQAQMRELQGKMRDLSREQNKKNSEEMSKRMAERSKEMAERFSQNFDKTFSDKFKDFGQKFQFNFDKSDKNLDQKVQSGDVKLKTKTYSKSYSIDRDDKVQIDNRFGKVTVTTWAKNEVKVDVEIKAYADDDSKAQELLDRISISDSKDNNGVSFATNIKEDDNHNSFWGTWSSNGKSSVRKAIINYVVYMPAKNPLGINNKYGGVELPDLYGKLTINNAYGNLSAKTLGNTDNSISVKYGSAGIGSLAGGDLTVAYGSLNLESAGKLDAKLSYGSGKIGKLLSSGTINVRYGGLQVDVLDASVKNLAVNSDYSPVKLGTVGNADFDVTVRYGGFSYNDNAVNVTSKTPSDDSRGWSSTKNYKGHVGRGSNDRTITVKANYAGVKIDQ